MKQVICRDKTVWMADGNEVIMVMRADEDVYWTWFFTVPEEPDLEGIITDVANGKYDTAGYSEDTDLKGAFRAAENFFADIDEENMKVALSTYGYIANL